MRELFSSVSNLKEGFCHRSSHFGKNDLNGLSFDYQSLREWVYQEGEKNVVYWCMPLFYHLYSSGFSVRSLFSFFSFLSFLSFYLSFLPFLLPFIVHSYPLFRLSAMVGFTIFSYQLFLAPYGYPSRTVHWPAGYSATTIAQSVLVAPLSILRQNYLSCFLPLSVFHFTHPD